MDYKRYRVSKTLKSSVENVLIRRCIKHQFVEDDDEIYCLLRISNKQFHKIIIRAKMEKIQEERGMDLPLLAEIEQGDRDVLAEISSCAYGIYDPNYIPPMKGG